MANTARAFCCLNILLLCALGLAPQPAGAAGAANFISFSTTSGQVTGVVQSDDAYVALAVLSSGQVVETFDPVPVSNGNGRLDFAISVWGLGSGSITAAVCASPTECDAPSAQESFSQTGVEPTVSWPTSTAVGPGDFTIAVTDPIGGGFLFAKIQPQGAGAAYQAVSRSGSTTLNFVAEGATAISILRCHDASVTWCQTTDSARQVIVNRVLEVSSVQATPFVTGPANGYGLTAHIELNEEPGQDVQITWEVYDGAGVTTGISGAGGRQMLGQVVDLEFSVPGLADGAYEVRGTVSIEGLTAGYSGMNFTVDGTPPGGATLSSSPEVFYPYPDEVRRFKDRATFRVALDPATGSSLVSLEILDPSGSVVRTIENQTATGFTFVWTGRDDADTLLAAGIYTVRVSLEDPNGNRNFLPPQTIRLRDEQLTLKTLRRSLSAVESASSNWKARCSAIRRPASRGWAGSLQLISNGKCRARTWLGSGVATVNGTRLPPALEPGRFQISAIGGAARGSATSVAVLEYWNNNTKKWVNGTRLSSAVGSHSGPKRLVTPMLYDGRRVAWRVATGFGMRYDVRAFEVTYTYLVLE